ncbi:MAG: alpha/beta hydrolase [Planctomycetota bacterium]
MSGPRTRAGAALAFERSGSGDPVVLLHGLGADRGVWREAAPLLSRKRDVVAVDLLGFGASPRPAGELSLLDLAAALRDLLDELSLYAVDLVGNSLGGWLALHLAVTDPARIRRVVAVAPAFLYGLPDSVTAADLAAAAAPRDFESMRAYLGRVLRAADARTDEAVHAHLERRIAARDERSIRALAESIVAGEGLLTDRLANVAAPTLVVHGQHDGVVPLAQSERVSSEIGGATLRVLEESAHWPQLDETEAFVRAVEEFLS